MKSDIFSHFINIDYLPRWGVMLLDVFLCTIAYGASILIGSSIFTYGLDSLIMPIYGQGLIVLAVQIFCFWCFHTYSGIIRYSTFIDLWKVLGAVFSTTVALLIANVIARGHYGANIFLNTSLIIYGLLSFILLFCFRVGVKTFYDSLMQGGIKKRKVLIYGTKQAGQNIAKMLRSSDDAEYKPVGFITDGNEAKVHQIQGLRVFPMNKQLIAYMKAEKIEDVIVSPIKMQEIQPSKVLNIFLKNNIRVLTTPAITEWEDTEEDHKNLSKIDSIRIEDLLERDTISVDTENVSSILHGKVVLVTGAAGSIGSEIVRQVLSFNPSALIIHDQAESPLHDLRMELNSSFPDHTIISIIGDVRNRKHLEQLFREYHPTVIFHAAAYKHVPLMEEFPNEAVQANVLGTRNMADLAVQYNVERFVMISTDKAVNPTNVMGASKRIAEIYVQALFRKLEKDNPNCTKFITTRFGNVLGSNGSVIPYFKKQIAAGGPVTVTHPDIIRFFMTIPEAVTLVLEAATLGNGGEIFVFDMGHPIKILDLAKNMIRLAGYKPGEDIMITFTGLRPGEKLYEEVLNQKETTLPTSNNKIMIAKVREEDYQVVQKAIDHLINTSQGNKAMLTVSEMKAIVPEYKSKNSIYEQLD